MLFNVNNIVLVALAASPLVAAHGKVAVLAGDAGGNGTALGIQGAVVAGAGSNSKTELDTTVFGSTKIATNGLGKTSGGGQNTLDGLTQAVALSGSTLPQVSSSNGSLSGTFHIVTTDGAGPVQAVVDPTATGQYESGTAATVATQVPGTRGNIAAPKQRRFIPRTLVKLGLLKRASNVNEDYPLPFKSQPELPAPVPPPARATFASSRLPTPTLLAHSAEALLSRSPTAALLLPSVTSRPNSLHRWSRVPSA